ncbi:MAG: UDP-N-acetylmuramoyl-tripeptide--D-alanyl-D-alanine ligase [Actinobacteria bacterium]|nr:UDP-N-acetylmuramoyl-tripeptide--D-alanyl-D-alanine ligase [Actinomycetota bacterium]
MIPVSLDEVARVLGAEVMAAGARTTRKVARVSTDTRTLRRGDLFVALKGRRYDAHDFLERAVDAGAAALLVSRAGETAVARARAAGVPLLRVRNTMGALAKLASWQREMLGAEVAAITGSTGKTITKDFAASILSRAGTVAYPRESYNNEVGVPLTILEARPGTRFLVLEMGSRGAGHISYLCAIARPRVGVVTNIGYAHLRYFRTRDGIAAAKGELLRALPPEGTAVINAGDDYASYLRRQAACRTVTFGCARGAEVRAERIKVGADGRARFVLRLKGGEKGEVLVPLPGRHNVENALAAAALGEIMGVNMEGIIAGIEGAKVTGWRMEMISKPDEITIINDAYNANPVSMRSALMALGDIARGKRTIAVLGDMAELGPVSEQAHLEVGRMAVDYGTDILITVGRKARKIAQAAREKGLPRGSVYAVEGVDRAAEILRAIIEPGDVVLIKGSRFLGLEKLVQMVA